jgi:hypothetical protein
MGSGPDRRQVIETDESGEHQHGGGGKQVAKGGAAVAEDEWCVSMCVPSLRSATRSKHSSLLKL